MSAVIPLYVKTAYHDEPSFANTKVVTSLFQSQLKHELGEKFKHSVEFREAKLELLNQYKDEFDFIELGKMAIDYSDGVIEASKKVNSTLLKYAATKNVPVLKYPGDDFADAYKDFYESICPNE